MKQDQILTVADLSAKFKSKLEMYNVLTREANKFDSKQDATQKFLRQILLGTNYMLNEIMLTSLKCLNIKDCTLKVC